ncbi:MAG TPA: DUF480 domain-containing protein [Planctomycetaceae bacterium]|nr:DUF480 domain-containing protein [Planctomycetaceae bacterium]
MEPAAAHDEDNAPSEPVRELRKAQRRVLGVLVEKALTTPEYYPLTLKAVTAGCNQKSNRDPVTSFSEEQVLETLDELRELGLAAVVHTESGRTARYRHYMRHRYSFTEPQLAILTELLLRGRQTPGELRARASRMVAIENLDQLRDALAGLVEQGYAQTSGPLERRGVEIDHTFYPMSEGRTPLHDTGAGPAEEPATLELEQRARAPFAAAARPSPASEGTLEELRRESRELREEIEALRDEFRALDQRFEELRRDLGG